MKLFYRLSLITLLSMFISITIQAQEYTENEVKAGYLYNFTKFVTWPKAAFVTETSTFIIGVYNDDDFADVLEKVIKDRKILNRNWVIFRYKVPKDIENCHMLFVSNATKVEIKNIFDQTKGKPVLIVGNTIEDFCELGGIINIAGKQSNKRFQINFEASKKVNLIISSKLLALAKIVKEDEIKF